MPIRSIGPSVCIRIHPPVSRRHITRTVEYGFKSQTDITASGTFQYDDVLRLPFASFAVQILRIGVGDDIADVTALAKSTFQSALGAMAGFNRDGAAPLVYRYGHDT
jgi:hypothetical protein